MKSLLIIVVIYTSYTLINSCGSGSANNNSNQRHNEGMISNQKYETELAYKELVKIFGSPNEFKLTEIYSEQIEKIDVYDETIPRNVYFYYTFQSENELYCSKFYVENRSVTKVFHKLTTDETQEFESTLIKSEELTEDVIDGIISTIDSLY